MKHKSVCQYWLAFVSAGLLLFMQAALAQEHMLPPFALKDFTLASIAGDTAKATLKFTAEMRGSGEVAVTLLLPEIVKPISDKIAIPLGRVVRGQLITKEWEIPLPKDGYYLAEIGLSFFPDETDEANKIFTKYQSYPLYFEIKESKLASFSQSPDPRFTRPTEEDQKEPNEHKPRAVPVPFDSTKGDSTRGKANINVIQGTASYNITVQISGRIRYTAAFGVTKGVPDVGVYLDWDYDNNPNTGYTPYYGGNIQHVDYDKTDNTGYYYFSFTFTGSQPANQYSPRIRVYANNANSAAFDGNLGNGAKFPVYHYIDISSATTYVYSNTAHITVDANQGGALRHLHRAHQFSLNRLSFTPSQLRYYIKLNQSNSFFCEPGGGCQDGSNINAPRIIFNRLPGSHLGYHEYGHFIEYAKVGFIPSTSYNQAHWFRKETEHVVAWREGWAEFYDAATHMYWYSVELPTLIEPTAFGDEGSVPHNLYQFLDASQGLLFTNRNNTRVEGAVACFFYSLWDGVALRASGYTGDNDDISYWGGFILDRLPERYNVLGQLIGPTHIEAYKNALLNALDGQNDASVNALYGQIITRTSSARPATPTSLQVSGTSSSRSLTWNDNTCPNSVIYTDEAGVTSTYDLVENQETGFRVYRKATSGSWDGTLNGYSLVATVGANITNWTDNAYLTGSHSYVVVAYNSGGNSLPKAEFTATYTPPLSVTITGPTSLGWKQTGTWTANASGGAGSYTYEWRYRYNGTGSWSGVVGTSQTYTRTMLDTDFELQVKVASNGEIAYDTHYVNYGIDKATEPSVAEDSALPEDFILSQNFPNPFNPQTEIRFGLPVAADVNLVIFNLLGQPVRTLVSNSQSAGYYRQAWYGNDNSGRQAASGVYIYRIEVKPLDGSTPFTAIRKMILSR